MVLPTRLGIAAKMNAAGQTSAPFGPIPNIPPGFIKSGDVWIATIRGSTNRLEASSVGVPAGWSVLAQSAVGQNVQMIIWKTALDSERETIFQFTNLPPSGGGIAITTLGLYEGLDMAAPRVSWNTAGTAASGRDLIRVPAMTIAFSAWRVDAGSTQGSANAVAPLQDGWVRDSRISSTNNAIFRLGAVVADKTYVRGDLGRVPLETWATPTGVNTARTLSVTIPGSDPNRYAPPIQPLNWYVGGSQARIYRGAERIG